MSSDAILDEKQRRVRVIIIAYPFLIFILSLALNYFLLGVSPFVLAMPSYLHVNVIVVAAVLLLINHSWLMTATELKRLRYKMHATPEEWVASGTNINDISEDGKRELERVHNAHRNSSENTIHFVFLLLGFTFSSPSEWAMKVWVIGFALARLAYTYSYLTGRDNARGAAMTLSLLAMYGIAGNLILSIFSL